MKRRVKTGSSDKKAVQIRLKICISRGATSIAVDA
jgi:hypothetical protein